MEIFENCDSKTIYNKFKLLENSYKEIINEIPLFDIDKITVTRKFNEWDNENGRDFLEKKLKDNKEWIYSWDVNSKMFNFPLMYLNNVIGIADTLCPLTINLLKQMGGINVAGFSLILPGGSLVPHRDDTGPSFNSMALNMFLIGDNSRLYININDKYEQYIHKEGKIVIFNAENEHYADNNGEINRVILYVNFET